MITLQEMLAHLVSMALSGITVIVPGVSGTLVTIMVKPLT